MKHIQKALRLLFTVLPLLLCLSIPAAAAPPRVVDSAGLLTNAELTSLTAILEDATTASRLDIAVVTMTHTKGRDVYDFAADYYDNSGYGIGSDRSGILLLVSMETREYAIVTTGAAMDIFSESDLTTLERAFKSDLSNGVYYDAFTNFAETAREIVKYDNRLTPIWIIVALIFGAGVAVIVLILLTRKHKSVRSQRTADSYMLRDTFRLERSRDFYLYSHITRIPRPQINSGGSRSGGSRSRGGGSHGGRSGGF